MFNIKTIKKLSERMSSLEDKHYELQDFCLYIGYEIYEQLAEKLISLCELYKLKTNNIEPYMRCIYISINGKNIYTTTQNKTIVSMLREAIKYVENISEAMKNNKKE